MATQIKLREIINIQSSFSKLLDQNFLPIKTRYTLSKDGRKITNEIDEFSNMRNLLIKKYGEDKLVVGSEAYSSCQLEIDDLLDIDIELLTDVIDAELLMKDECTMSAKDFLILDWLIK